MAGTGGSAYEELDQDLIRSLRRPGSPPTSEEADKIRQILRSLGGIKKAEIPLPPITTADDPYVLEDHPMNTAEDDYEIYVDHEDGQRIKWKPKVKKKEIFIGPDGRPLPEDVQEQIRGYGTEPDAMSFLDSFLNEDVAGVPYTLPDQQIFYETGGKVHQMPRPIKQDYDMERLIQSMKDRYRV